MNHPLGQTFGPHQPRPLKANARHRPADRLSTDLLSLLCIGCIFLGTTDAIGQGQTLVDHADGWRMYKGTNAPVDQWQTLADDLLPADWSTVPGGVGYGDDAIEGEATVLSDMAGNYTTVYIRQTFEIIDPPATNLVLRLMVDFDDAFVAYLDGREVGRENVDGVINEVAPHDATAAGNHEASCCDSSANPTSVYDLGFAVELLEPGMHVLAIQGLNVSAGSSDFHLIADLTTIEASLPQGPELSGTFFGDVLLTQEESPYRIVGDVTVSAGATLFIEPGVLLLFNQGRGLTINGRLLAEGSPEARIEFAPEEAATSWNRIRFNAGTNESRIRYATIDGAAGSGNITARDARLLLENVVFTNTVQQLITVDDSSIVIRDCVFPNIENNELIHFHGMPDDGYALISGNLFGTTTGYNDIIDFTGGNRPGPIVEFYDNVFPAAVDDVFDMDGCDAHIEGNVFMNVRQDANRASSSNPISTGADGGETSELVIVRNFFVNCEHALLLKDDGSAVFQNNTVLTITTNYLGSQPPGVINFGEPNRGVPGGAGALFDGNIVWDLQAEPFVNFESDSMFLSVNHSTIQGRTWPGEANSEADPLFLNTTDLNYLNVRSNLTLQMGSPAIGTGPNGLDQGAAVPAGVTVSGISGDNTTNRQATLQVGGPGVYAYRWSLDGGPWSEEIPLTNSIVITADLFADAEPLMLTNLTVGRHQLALVGKNSAGSWQATSAPTYSPEWIVLNPEPIPVSGIIETDTTWTAEQGEWLVASDLVVTNGALLTISPGTVVHLAGQSTIRVLSGELRVLGDAEEQVRFDSLTQEPYALEAEGTNAAIRLQYAEVEGGAIRLLAGATGLLEDSFIHGYLNGTDAILYTFQPTLLTVRRCHFADYHEILSRKAINHIEDCLFERILGDGFDVDAALPDSFIRDSTFRHGLATNVDAIDIGRYLDGTPTTGMTIARCLIYDFPFDKGISVGESASGVQISDCLIRQVASGVAVKDSSVAHIDQITVTESERGVYLYEKVAGSGGGQALVMNSVLWGNAEAVTLDSLSTIEVTYSCLQTNPVYGGIGNRNEDPQFSDPTQGDFRPDTGSSLWTAGSHGQVIGVRFPIGTSLDDTDQDGLPDRWELEHGLDPWSELDATLDPDLDGLINSQEFWCGSDPQDPASQFKIQSARATDGGVEIAFAGLRGRGYDVEISERLPAASWTTTTNVPALTEDGTVNLFVSPVPESPMRFYRVVVTGQPPRP